MDCGWKVAKSLLVAPKALSTARRVVAGSLLIIQHAISGDSDMQAIPSEDGASEIEE